MREYKIGLVPGPTTLAPGVLEAVMACGSSLGSGDLEDEFVDDYVACQAKVKQIVNTTHDVCILTGEGMAALWGALRSVLLPNDRVLSVDNGVYGHGIGEMAAGCGAAVTFISSSPRTGVDVAAVIAEIHRVKPALVTMVHCDTPTGVLNPLGGVGAACQAVGALLYVDFVSSVGGVAIVSGAADGAGAGAGVLGADYIDLGLAGSQKVFSSMADLSIVTVSPRAWERIEKVKYIGYDALLPFQTAVQKKYFPHTPHWHGIVALNAALDNLLREGLEAVQKRHQDCAALCRKLGREIGLETFITDDNFASPTVTCFLVPEDIKWVQLDQALRSKHGMVVGGSYGEFAGRVFRVGHMGSQANEALVVKGMDCLRDVLKELRG